MIEAVGHLAVQMARFGGARVIATVGGPEGAAHAGAAGAEIIDRRQGDVAARVMELTGGAGVDRVVEVDFAANCAVDAAVLKPNGWVASYSSSSDPTPVLPYYAFQSKGLNLRLVQGFNLSPEARAAAQRFVADHAGALRIAIGARFPLTDIAAAYARVEAGGSGIPSSSPDGGRPAPVPPADGMRMAGVWRSARCTGPRRNGHAGVRLRR